MERGVTQPFRYNSSLYLHRSIFVTFQRLRPVILTSICLAVALATVSSLPAQSSRSTLELAPVVGGGFFLSDMADPIETETGTPLNFGLDNSLVPGLTLGFPVSTHLALELTGFIVDSEFSASGGGVSAGVDMDVFIVGGSAVYSFPSETSAITPFVAGGAGVKGYEGSPFGTETDLMGSVGGGIRIDPGGFPDVRLEVRDYMSVFDSSGDGSEHFQHDLLFTTGVVIGLF